MNSEDASTCAACAYAEALESPGQLVTTRLTIVDPAPQERTNYTGTIAPGQVICLSLAAGAKLVVSEPGLRIESILGSNQWIRLHFPYQGGHTAIAHGLFPSIHITADGVVGPAWISGRPALGANAPDCGMQPKGYDCRPGHVAPDDESERKYNLDASSFSTREIGSPASSGKARQPGSLTAASQPSLTRTGSYPQSSIQPMSLLPPCWLT